MVICYDQGCVFIYKRHDRWSINVPIITFDLLRFIAIKVFGYLLVFLLFFVGWLVGWLVGCINFGIQASITQEL